MSAYDGAKQVRACDQSQDREGHRPHNAAVRTRPRRPGDRIILINVRFWRRVQPIDATPSNLTREGGVRWRGLHGYGSRRSRGLSFGSAGRTVNVWRISLGRLRGGTRAVSIVSWLSMVALLRSRAGELRER